MLSRTVIRIVLVENERRRQVGSLGAVILLRLLLVSGNTALARGSSVVKKPHQPKRLGTLVKLLLQGSGKEGISSARRPRSFRARGLTTRRAQFRVTSV